MQLDANKNSIGCLQQVYHHDGHKKRFSELMVKSIFPIVCEPDISELNTEYFQVLTTDIKIEISNGMRD